MASIAHAIQNGMAHGRPGTQANVQEPDQIPETLPPAYTRHSCTFEDLDSNDEDEDLLRPSSQIVLRTGVHIHGNYNAVPQTAQTLQDTTRCTAQLAHAIIKGLERAGRSHPVHIAIHCGIDIYGDRNVVGPVTRIGERQPTVPCGNERNNSPIEQIATEPRHDTPATDATTHVEIALQKVEKPSNAVSLVTEGTKGRKRLAEDSCSDIPESPSKRMAVGIEKKDDDMSGNEKSE